MVNGMTTKLTTIGDALYLVIDPSILEGLKIDQDTPLEVTIDGSGLYIRPASAGHHARVVETAERVMDIHAETLRKLAQ